MKKLHLAVALISISISLLCVQVIILQTLITKEEQEDSVDPVWKVIHLVTSIGSRQGVPLFLIDPLILRHIQNGSTAGHTGCQILCLGQKITHLATMGTLSSQVQKDSFIEEMKSLAIKPVIFTGHDPTLLLHELRVSVPLHYILFIGEQVIHIVVLYERPGKFWWYPPLNVSGLYWKDINLESYMDVIQEARSYNRVEVQPAVLDGIRIFVPVKPSVFLQPYHKVHFVECNYSRAKSFYEKYAKDESEEAELFRTKAWKLVSKAKLLLDQLSIPFWLSSGTCLGYFRQCDFIPHSKDVDIGIWIKDYRPEIVPVFSTHDLPLTHSFGKVEDSFELSFRDGDIKLDVFFFYEEADYVWNGGTQARTGKKFKYIFQKFQLCWTEFLELKLRVPCPTEDYIRANYGSNWFEQVKTWDWKSSPPNVEENGQWPVEEWPEVIQLIPLPEQT